MCIFWVPVLLLLVRVGTRSGSDGRTISERESAHPGHATIENQLRSDIEGELKWLASDPRGVYFKSSSQ